MKKLILSFILCFTLIFPLNSAEAAMDPKVKAFAVVCTYGTVGGALLGFASMAFGTNSRAIAQGASLGLYAGIIFGTYVLTSYKGAGGEEYNTYPEADPYAPPGYPPAGGYPAPSGGFGAPVPQDDGSFFGSPRRVMEIQQDYQSFQSKKGSNMPPIYMNLLNLNF